MIRGGVMGGLNCDIYYEDAFLKHLNAGNIVIDEEKYQEFRAYGLTGNDENLVLMMELMSNSDFDKSVVYLLFLLKEFGSPIQKLKKESTQVNFRSLMSYLKLNVKKLGELNIYTMTGILRKHKQFTPLNAMRVATLFSGDTIDYSDSGNVCWTNGPVLKQDCETLLDINDDTN